LRDFIIMDLVIFKAHSLNVNGIIIPTRLLDFAVILEERRGFEVAIQK